MLKKAVSSDAILKVRFEVDFNLQQHVYLDNFRTNKFLLFFKYT